MRHRNDDDFVQRGAVYRVMKPEKRQRLIDNVVGSLRQVTRRDVVERSVSNFRSADAELGERLAQAIARKS